MGVTTPAEAEFAFERFPIVWAVTLLPEPPGRVPAVPVTDDEQLI